MEDKRVNPKKQLSQRLFSEEDEIVILKVLLDYSAKKCIDPIEDFYDFHDSAKKSIHVDVTSAQLADKIWRMKGKIEKKASKTKESVFGKPHEQLCYDLSRKSAYASGGSELWEREEDSKAKYDSR